MLKSMLFNKDFQTWHLIGWQHSRQPIRSHVRKSLLTNMEFNMDFCLVTASPAWNKPTYALAILSSLNLWIHLKSVLYCIAIYCIGLIKLARFHRAVLTSVKVFPCRKTKDPLRILIASPWLALYSLNRGVNRMNSSTRFKQRCLDIQNIHQHIVHKDAKCSQTVA